MGITKDIAAAVSEILKTILKFFTGTENELTEEQLAGIEAFVSFIFML